MIPLRTAMHVVLNDVGRSKLLFETYGVFRDSVQRIEEILESYIRGRYTGSLPNNVLDIGISSQPQLYQLWLNVREVSGKPYLDPAFPEDEIIGKRPRPTVVATFPSDIQPEIGKSLMYMGPEKRLLPPGVILEEPAFSLQDLLYSINFGYGYGEDIIQKILNILQLFPEKADCILSEFCTNIYGHLLRKGLLDAADLHLLEMRNFAIEKYALPLGLDIPTKSPDGFELLSPVEERSGMSFEIKTDCGERKSMVDAGYAMAIEGKGVDVYKRSLSDDISLIGLERELYEEEIARIAVRIGFRGQCGIDRKNPPFTSLKGRGLNKNELETFLPYIWELLESFVMYDANNPFSAWFGNTVPIAVEDPLLVDFFDRMASIPALKRLEGIKKYARMLNYSYVSNGNTEAAPMTIYDLLIEDVKKTKTFERTVLGAPRNYEYFLSQLEDPYVIEKLHEALRKRQERFNKLPDTRALDEKERRLIESFSVGDRTDESIARAALDQIKEIKKNVSEKKSTFNLNNHHALGDYDAAAEMARDAVSKGETGRYNIIMPRPPIEDSQLKIEGYKMRLHDICPQISEDVVSFRLNG